MITAPASAPLAGTPADVLALFPKCSSCGLTLTTSDAVELDPKRPHRAKHARPEQCMAPNAIPG